MLSIIIIDGNLHKHISWEIGDDTLNNIFRGDFSEIQSVMATKDELIYVLENFDSLPRSWNNPLSQTWFGDHAKFILANW